MKIEIDRLAGCISLNRKEAKATWIKFEISYQTSLSCNMRVVLDSRFFCRFFFFLTFQKNMTVDKRGDIIRSARK